MHKIKLKKGVQTLSMMALAGLLWSCTLNSGSDRTISTELISRQEQSSKKYWDGTNLGDTTRLSTPESNEVDFAGYIVYLSSLDSVQIKESISDFLDRTRTDSSGLVFNYYLSLADKYLYDPNSPYRSEDLYIPFMNYVLKHADSCSATYQHAVFSMTMMLKNRVGSTAADISYILANGTRNNLHAIQSPYTLLYFYNPDCNSCRETTLYLKESPLIDKLTKEQQLTLLGVYPDGDIESWKKHFSEMPSWWQIAHDRDQQINKNRSYDLRAIPSLYLLDENKKVLLKDASAIEVERFLSSKYNLLK